MTLRCSSSASKGCERLGSPDRPGGGRALRRCAGRASDDGAPARHGRQGAPRGDRRRANERRRPCEPVSDAGAEPYGAGRAAAASAASAPPAAGNDRLAAPGAARCAGHDRRPGLLPAPGGTAGRDEDSPPALCGAFGLGLEAGTGAEAGASGGSSAGAASLRAALFHAPWPGLHLCRPSRAGDHVGHPGRRGVPGPAWHLDRGTASLRAARQPAVRAEPAPAHLLRDGPSPRGPPCRIAGRPADGRRRGQPRRGRCRKLRRAGHHRHRARDEAGYLCRQRRRARGLGDGCGRIGGRRHAGRHRLSRQSDFRRHRPAHDQGQIRIPGEPAARPRRDARVPAGELPAGEAGRGARPAAQRSGGPRRAAGRLSGSHGQARRRRPAERPRCRGRPVDDQDDLGAALKRPLAAG